MKHTIEITYDIQLSFTTELGDTKARKLVGDRWDREERWADDAQFCLERWAQDAIDQRDGASAIQRLLERHLETFHLMGDLGGEMQPFTLTDVAIDADASVEEV